VDTHSVEKRIASIHQFEGLVSGIADGIQMLDQMLKDAADSNEKIVETHTRVRQVLESYSSEVDAESAAVSTLARSLAQITDSSQQKYQDAAKLLELSEGTRAKLQVIKHAIDKIVDSAGKMNEMAQLITDVSSHTVSEEIRGIARMLQELLSGMKDMSESA
jgi:methyl-accepting chemotaxis protein